MELVTCEFCGREIPLANFELHSMRCHQPPSLSRSTSDNVWQQQLEELREELLQEFPQISEEMHPARELLLLAEDAVQSRKWEAAFNHLFEAQQVARATAEHAVVLVRTQSEQVASITGESKEVARRLIDEAGGDADEAVDRAFLIHGLEEGQSQLELNSEDIDCLICCCSVGLREAVRLQPCGHGWYCITCVQRTVDAKMEDGIGLSSLTCLEPSCGFQLTERVLRALLTRAQIDCLHRRDLEAAVASSSNIRPCPTPDCPNRVALEDGIEPRLLCSFCGQEHCLLCSASPYHFGKSCEEHLAEVRASAAGDENSEEQFVRWMNEVGAKQCPTCQMVVTKQNLEQQATQSVECHKMICRSCKTKFCFNCRAILTDSSCGCTPLSHGFIDPDTGGFVSHRVSRSTSTASPAAKPKARAASPAAKPKARAASPAAKPKARATSPAAKPKARAGSPARQRSPAAASPGRSPPR